MPAMDEVALPHCLRAVASIRNVAATSEKQSFQKLSSSKAAEIDRSRDSSVPMLERALAFAVAGVAKLAIRGRLKIGCPQRGACGFESRPRHRFAV